MFLKSSLMITGVVLLFSCNTNTKKDEKPIEEKSIHTEETVTTGDNSRNSLDWPGTYSGILPCADCEGIETTIVLQSDNTFSYKANYLGKQQPLVVESKGGFTWDASGGKISLEGIKGETIQYLVGENKLFHLDMQGQRITGDLATKYELIKQ